MSLIRINHHPSSKQLRVFAVAWLVFFGVAGVAWWLKGKPWLAVVLGSAAAGAALPGLIAPQSIRRVYVGLSYATYPIGFVVSHIVLAVLYYGVLTPLGFLMRVCRYDPLERRRDRTASTYWRARRPSNDSSTYFRQS
jgi:hypothetical protein